jgi:hypothetical protein
MLIILVGVDDKRRVYKSCGEKPLSHVRDALFIVCYSDHRLGGISLDLRYNKHGCKSMPRKLDASSTEEDKIVHGITQAMPVQNTTQ